MQAFDGCQRLSRSALHAWDNMKALAADKTNDGACGHAMAVVAPRARHGAHCDCLLLAAATQARPSAVTFSYCRRVLQQRYAMTCRHGEAGPPAEVPGAAARWADRFGMDPVKAILLKNS